MIFEKNSTPYGGVPVLIPQLLHFHHNLKISEFKVRQNFDLTVFYCMVKVQRRQDFGMTIHRTVEFDYDQKFKYIKILG